MNAAVQLALMSKAKKVFGDEGTFLCFPVTPLSFTKEDLSFLATKNLDNLHKFSMLVNLVPQGEAWPPADAQYLWDVYEDVLRSAQLASSTRTPEEDKQYETAYSYLHSTAADKTEGPSDQYKAYAFFRDKILEAQEQYNSKKQTADSSSDPNPIWLKKLGSILFNVYATSL